MFGSDLHQYRRPKGRPRPPAFDGGTVPSSPGTTCGWWSTVGAAVDARRRASAAGDVASKILSRGAPVQSVPSPDGALCQEVPVNVYCNNAMAPPRNI